LIHSPGGIYDCPVFASVYAVLILVLLRCGLVATRRVL
jgi:hypothetical protein